MVGSLCTLVIFFVLANLAKPVWDIDTYWHLASGRFFAQTGTFPRVDPFGTTATIDAGRSIILNQYWLAQVLLYGAYLLCGDYGIILLRSSLFFLLFALILYRFRAATTGKIFLLPLLLLLGSVAGYFTGDRPQLFSFFFFAVLICQLEAVFRRDETPGRRTGTLLTIPLLMLLWANMHPGYLLGVLVILLYLAVDGYQRLRAGKKFDRSLYALLLATPILTGLNPNGYTLFMEVVRFENSEMQGRTSEYLPPWRLFPEMRLYAYWLYAATLLAVVFLRRKTVAIMHLILFAMLFLLSLRSFRYVPFFVFGTAVCLPDYLAFVPVRKFLAAGLLLVSVVVIGLQLEPALQTVKAMLANPVDATRFPQKTVDYMREKRLSGRVFNHINFGGYLIWQLFPDCRMMIDGRNLNKSALTDYTRILWLPAESMALLDSRQIDLVVIPEQNPFSRERYPLFDLLAQSPAWRLVYRDTISSLFMRSGSPLPPP